MILKIFNKAVSFSLALSLPGVNILSTAQANALDEFMKIGHLVDKLELFWWIFFIFLKKN